MDGRAEDARLLHLGHCVERTHRSHRVGSAHFENRTRLEDALELVHRAMRSQFPCLDDRNPLTVLRLVEVVRRHEHCDAARGKRVDETPESPARKRVDTAGGLIEKDDGRFVKDRAAERQALTPAAGEGSRQLTLSPAQARHLQDEVAPGCESITFEPIHAPEEGDVLIDGQRLVKREAL
jgi:hypothetical protein